MINILAGYDMRALGFNSADSVHVMTEAMRIAYFDRNNSLGDPAFINNPLDKLLSTSYADRARRTIHQTDATPSQQPENKQVTGERPETTHYSVVDGQGNAVSTTYTVNGRFGAVVMAPDTGFSSMTKWTTSPPKSVKKYVWPGAGCQQCHRTWKTSAVFNVAYNCYA